jgi:putative ABC transport system ATP-binding protein
VHRPEFFAPFVENKQDVQESCAHGPFRPRCGLRCADVFPSVADAASRERRRPASATEALHKRVPVASSAFGTHRSTDVKKSLSRLTLRSTFPSDPVRQVLGGKLTAMAANEAGVAAFRAGAPILQVRDLRTNILKPASFSLSAGEALAVRGPSGAGKTLLLRAVADLDPNEGLVTLGGRDRSTIAGPEWRRLVGYVPAEPGWWADTVSEHFGEWTAALAFVRDLGFPEAAKAWPITRLSTGERLRLALARALIVSPRILLLDEPTVALDVSSMTAVESLIKARMRTGLAVLWVTHDAEQAKRVAHRLLVVEAGRVREEAAEWTVISR